MPDPEHVGDLPEFIDALARLRIWAGAPSYRRLAKLVGPTLRPPQELAQSTLADLFQPRRRRIDVDLATATVRALGLGEAEVARWRTACVRVQTQAHAQTHLRPPPRADGPMAVYRQLPADLATFHGREKELARLMARAMAPEGGTAPATVVVSAIEGMAGIGKTRFAVHAAHALVAVGRFADVQLYVNLRGFDPESAPADPAAVLDGFLRQLGVPPADMPPGLDERAAMFRDRLHERSALVLLDNAADENQVLPLIPAGPDCLVLITSRRSLAGLDGAELCRLDVFSPGEALDLLVRIVGAERVAAEPEAAERIGELCGRLPLAVGLVAARLRARTAWSLHAMANRLAEDGLEAFSAGDRRLRAVFDLSYRELPDPAQRLFRALGAFPGDDFGAETAAAAAGLGATHARTLLEQLCDEYLLQERTSGRYSSHDLLRGYARQVQSESEPEWAEVAARLVSYYLHTADNADRALSPAAPLDREIPPGCTPTEFADREAALAWFDLEYANLLAILEFALDRGDLHAAAQLPMIMSGYFFLRARASDWAKTMRVSVAAAKELGDVKAQGTAWRLLGMALSSAGDPSGGAEATQEAVTASGAAGDSRGRASALNNLAVMYERYLDRKEEARELLREALAEHRRIGNRVGEGTTLQAIGSLELGMGDPDGAVESCEQALAMHRATGRRPEAAQALHLIGQAHDLAGRPAEAEAAHLEALAESRASGARRTEARCLHRLGLLRRAAGDDAAAVEHLRQALAVCAELDDPLAAEIRALLDSRGGDD